MSTPPPQRQVPHVNADAALKQFMRLAAVPGPSGQERDVAETVAGMLRDAGVAEEWIRFDDADGRTRLRGNCGNLIVSLPGSRRGPRTMLSAHMDTVPICVGSEPVIEGDVIRSGKATGVGADNRSGCAAILTAALERLALGDPSFPPAVLVFFVQEEVGLEGARHLDVSKVGPVDRAFNFDGGTVEKLTVGAVGGERMSIRLRGIPAHAGVSPQDGASAIVMASLAIAELHEHAWLGRVEKDGQFGTANVGVIGGGEATNVVTPEVTLRAEARSHDSAMRSRITAEIRAAFERSAARVANREGRCGSVEFESHVDYEAFRLAADHPSVAAAADAVREVGREPYQEAANGGLDANWLFRHGLEAVTLGCGQRNIHSADEYLDTRDFVDACRIATRLLTGGALGDG